jgi:membrane-bound metal-dependent hydrolase YbcI (DUF457 family)
MPLPVAHTAAAIGLGLVATARTSAVVSRKKWVLLLAVAVFLAILPDFDILQGLLLRDPQGFHRRGSHSVLFALLVGAVVGWACRIWVRELPAGRVFLLMTGAALTHPLLDCFSADTSAPFGVALLWPFSNEYYISSVALFSDVHKSADASEFFASLFNLHNLLAIRDELLFAGVILCTGLALRSERKAAMYLLGTVAFGALYAWFRLVPQWSLS